MRGAVFLAKDWLPFNEGLHVSNMPMKPAALADYCRRHYGRDCDAERRVIRIPDEMLARWRRFAEKDKETGELLYMDGPWDEFGPGKRWPLSGTHIAIDEAHLYIPSAENVEKRRAWRNWLREIGHHGATVEFITQNLEGLDKQVDKISELRYTISSRVSDLDFLLRIPMADWYELKGGLCGEWRPWIQQFEKRRVDKGWSNAARKMAELRPEFFELYESFSRPQAEEGDGGEAVHVVEHEFQRRSFPSLLWWFIRRHFERLFAAVAVLCLGVWMCFGGGVPLVLMWFLSFVKQFTNSEASAAPEQVEQVESVGYGPDRGKPEVGSELVDAAPDGSGLELPLETVVWSGPEGVITVKDYSSLADEVRFLETQAAVQAEELEKFRKETGEVIVMTPERVTFSSGERVGIGQKISRSGKTNVYITSISFPRREVLLSDGTVLTLRVSERKGSSIFPRLQGRESDRGGSGPGGDGGGGGGRAGDYGGGRNGNAGNDAGAVDGDRGQRDMGGGSGPGLNQSGSQPGSPGSGDGAYSQEARGGAVDGRRPVLSRPVDAGGSGGDGGAGGAVGPENGY